MRILFFAHLKDAAGCAATELEAAAPLDATQLWVELIKKFPGLAVYRSSVRLARNQEYTIAETTFSNTDEVALIPPVSGG
jgi:molybdopterin converting factor subunit 1